MSLLKEILKARNRYYGKHNAYPAKLFLQSQEIEAELLREYLTMNIRPGTYKGFKAMKIAGTTYKIERTLTKKFEFRGVLPKWDEDD